MFTILELRNQMFYLSANFDINRKRLSVDLLYKFLLADTPKVQIPTTKNWTKPMKTKTLQWLNVYFHALSYLIEIISLKYASRADPSACAKNSSKCPYCLKLAIQ